MAKMRKGSKTLAIGALVLLALVAWVSLSFAEGRVLVEVAALRPEKVTIAKGEEVIWANATGGLIHIEFATQLGGHLFQVPKDRDLRVKFEQPGEHRYVVHIGLGGIGAPELQGAVVVK
ncbi:MAG: hypothetical protein ACK4Z6_00545 [Candidatus Methylomirabilales bacterium]